MASVTFLFRSFQFNEINLRYFLACADPQAMVKPFTQRRGTTMPPSSRSEYRIGIVDLTNYLWNPDDDQYKVLFKMVHVTKAALHIGYVQMLISFVFSAFFGYHYMMVSLSLRVIFGALLLCCCEFEGGCKKCKWKL